MTLSFFIFLNFEKFFYARFFSILTNRLIAFMPFGTVISHGWMYFQLFTSRTILPNGCAILRRKYFANFFHILQRNNFLVMPYLPLTNIVYTAPIFTVSKY